MLALESRLRRNVEVLGGEIGERHVGRPAALHSAESYIAGALSELDFEVSRQTYIAEGVASSNLEVTVPGCDRPGEIVLVGAHYDTVPGSPGADDNASGVAPVADAAAPRSIADTPASR